MVLPLSGREQRMNKAKNPSVTASQARILEAGRRLFFAEGFVGISTERLAKEAAVSKSTIYKYFGDMMGVLKAVIEAEADYFELDMARLPETPEKFTAALVKFGAELLRMITRTEKLQFDRLIFEQSRANPELAEIYYTATIERTQKHLAALIAHGQRQGLTAQESSPELLADHLLCMWQGLASVQARLGLIEHPIPRPQAWSKQCVEALF